MDLQSLAAVNAHDKDINSVAISPNESLVCTTSQDRTAKVGPLPASAKDFNHACI